MDNVKKEVCMQCKNHCPVDALQCGNGRKYFGISAENEEDRGGWNNRRKGHRHEDAEESLVGLLCKCGYIADRKSGRQRGQKRILGILIENPQISQKELLDKLKIEPGSMSEVLAKLEDKGLILREKDVNDRRKMLIGLTEEGRKAAEHFCGGEMDESMLDILTEEEKETLKMLLIKLLNHWRAECMEHGKHHHKGRRS